MKLIEINKEEFYRFASNKETYSFYQTREWAEVKRHEGWHTYFLGLDNNGKIEAATIILSRELPVLKKRIFYSPRGFIINYKDLEIMRTFTKYIKEFVENKNAIFIRIDPYLPYKKYSPVSESTSTFNKYLDILRSLGYTKNDENLTKPNVKYEIRLSKTLIKNFDEKIKDTIIDNERKGIHVENLPEDKIDQALNVIYNTDSKFDYTDSDIKDLYLVFKQNNMIDINLIVMDIDKYVENAKNQKEANKAADYKYKYGHSVILGCSVDVYYNEEVHNLCTAIMDEFAETKAIYNLHYGSMMEAHEKGYKKYCLYGFNFNPKDKLKAYAEKLNAKSIELIGEYDLVLNDRLYKLYKWNSRRKNNRITDFKKKSIDD